ncbi:MAG TPA: flippase-like domain-containing protein [Thermoanaerobaculia bacterium]|jgi:uncharacterized protein (TIRG00374 family)
MKRIERIGFAAGVLLLCWLLYRIGPNALLANLSEVGWGFLLVLALHGFNVLFNALAWRRVLPADHSARLPLPVLAEMQVAGDAVNAVNPLGVVGGELMRVRLLSRVLPVSAATASVGLVATAQFVSQILFVLSGTPLTIHWIHDAGVRKALWILCALLLVLFLLLLWMFLSRSVFEWIRDRLRRVGFLRRQWARIPERWKKTEAETLGVLRERPGSFILAVAITFLDWQLGVIEALVILHFLHQPVTFPQAYAIELLSVVIEGILFFVPAKIGTQEGGKVLIFLAMGLDPAKGLTLGVIRRLCGLLWAGVGLVFLGRFSRRVPA